MMKFVLAIMASLLVCAPAQARWRMAETENFVIYAEDSSEDIERFAGQLERYHQVLGIFTRRTPPPPTASNRLTIYVVGSQREVGRLAGNSRGVAGFYLPRAGGSLAFVQDIRGNNTHKTHFSMIVLLHEYAHHYLRSTTRQVMPRWYSEGFAEFLASARFPSEGGIEIGRPADHRVNELFYAREVDIDELLDDELYASRRGERWRFDAFYGRAWQLFHYLYFNKDRKGQLNAYELAIQNGASPAEAAQVFGDLDQLDNELDRYQRRRRLTALASAPEYFTEPTIALRELSDGMDEIVPLQIISKRGVSREEALELLPEVRAVAALYPEDPGVLAALAEAEFDAGNSAEAIAAADRAIALDPQQKNALIQKGYALFALAASAEDRTAAYAEAMKPFSALNAIEQDHPLPLIYYYRSFTERGAEPNETARHALERASILAPFDLGLALQAAEMFAFEGKLSLARQTLLPLAANPHGGEIADIAASYLGQIAVGTEGEPLTLIAPLPIEMDESETEDS